MGDFLLCVFHSTFDAQGKEGFLSLYYSNHIPIISFSRYIPYDNDDVQEYPFTKISSISIDAEKEGENFINIFVKGQLISASIFRLPSRNDVLSFIQISVSNGILNSDTNRQNSNKWIPVSPHHFKPRDSIKWIYDNSPDVANPNFSLSPIYLNSHPPFCENPRDGSFSLPKHREILRELIEKGKQTEIFQKLNQLSLKEEFRKLYNSSKNNLSCLPNFEEICNSTNNRNNDNSRQNQENKKPQNIENVQDSYTQSNSNIYNNDINRKCSINQNSNEIISENDSKNSQINDTKLFEYLSVRRQWEIRISHQIFNNSKHNNDVEKILKDLPRTISDEKIIVLLYTVLRTIITYAPDVGFAQGMVDVSYFIEQVILDDTEDFGDESQSYVFWGLHSILFLFGQSKWFQSLDSSNSSLIEVIEAVLTTIYPSLAEFIRFNDFEIFKHCYGSLLTMFTRMFTKEIEEKLWKLIFLKQSVDAFHASILTAIFCINYPKLCESKTNDMSHVTDLLNSNYIVENEENFLALIASICEMIHPIQEKIESFDFSCSLFQPCPY